MHLTVIHPKTLEANGYRPSVRWATVISGLRTWCAGDPLPSTPAAAGCREMRAPPPPRAPAWWRSLVTAPRLSATSRDKKKQAEVAPKIRRRRASGAQERTTPPPLCPPACLPAARCPPHPLVRPCRCRAPAPFPISLPPFPPARLHARGSRSG
jgi:hypothetical protein